MGARRPKNQPPQGAVINGVVTEVYPGSAARPPRESSDAAHEARLEAFVADTAAAHASAPGPKPLPSGIAYASIRLKSTAGKMRYSNNSLLVEATDDQTVTLFGSKVAPDGTVIPYVHFKIMPSGVEISAHNVTGAVPGDASIVDKLSRTGRLAKRAERLKERMGALAAENEAIQQAASIQEVEGEDDDLDESIDDEDDVEGGESEGEDDDGIDV